MVQRGPVLCMAQRGPHELGRVYAESKHIPEIELNNGARDYPSHIDSRRAIRCNLSQLASNEHLQGGSNRDIWRQQHR